MRNSLMIFLVVLLTPAFVFAQHMSKTDRARSIVQAVNDKDAAKYVENFSEDVKVYMYGENGDFILRVDGKEALYENRLNHFRSHPEVRNEIQHLAEVDNRLVMHDLVWLTPDRKKGSNVLEIFTFNDEGKIARVDVLQDSNLFSREE